MGDTKRGYWDVERCAWVGTDPTHDLPRLRPADDGDRPVPEPRPATEQAAPVAESQ